MAVVVDTDVVSFIHKNDTRAQLYRPHLFGQLPVISFMTLAELEFWAWSSHWGAQRRSYLQTYLRRFVVRHSTPELCERWTEVTFASRRAGRPIAATDAWIAATALWLNLPLVTHNASDYLGVPGLTVISES